jgi:hypothetical protein
LTDVEKKIETIEKLLDNSKNELFELKKQIINKSKKNGLNSFEVSIESLAKKGRDLAVFKVEETIKKTEEFYLKIPF